METRRSRAWPWLVMLVVGCADDTSTPATTDSGTTTESVSTDSTDGEPACDVIAQDCPIGHKCLPRQVSHIAIIPGQDPWCAGLDPDAAGFGEPCTVSHENFAEPGAIFETCGAGLICWDAEDAEGRCERLCGDGDAGPACLDGYFCAQDIGLNGVVCVPYCDPLAQDCPYETDTCNLMGGEWGCYPRDVSSVGTQGRSCGFQNDCIAGSACVRDDELAGCSNSFGRCCAALCDTSAAEPDEVCAAVEPGLTCRAWAEAEAAGFGAIGVCWGG